MVDMLRSQEVGGWRRIKTVRGGILWWRPMFSSELLKMMTDTVGMVGYKRNNIYGTYLFY